MINKKICSYCNTDKSCKFYNTKIGILCHRHYRQNLRGKLGSTKKVESHDMSNTTEYTIWVNMRRRCNDPTHNNYKDYGGRGITVCKEWDNSFIAFYKDMGDRPKNKTLDRKENNKGYCKENCRWATHFEQRINTRIQYNNTSGVKGVNWSKSNKKWLARIFKNKKMIYLGHFKNKKMR